MNKLCTTILFLFCSFCSFCNVSSRHVFDNTPVVLIGENNPMTITNAKSSIGSFYCAVDNNNQFSTAYISNTIKKVYDNQKPIQQTLPIDVSISTSTKSKSILSPFQLTNRMSDTIDTTMATIILTTKIYQISSSIITTYQETESMASALRFGAFIAGKIIAEDLAFYGCSVSSATFIPVIGTFVSPIAGMACKYGSGKIIDYMIAKTAITNTANNVTPTKSYSAALGSKATNTVTNTVTNIATNTAANTAKTNSANSAKSTPISSLTAELRDRRKNNTCDWFDPIIVGKLILEPRITNYKAKCRNHNNNGFFDENLIQLTNDLPWSDAVAFCDKNDNTYDTYVEVKTKFIDPASVKAFYDGKLTNIDIHGGKWSSFIDIVNSERNNENDGTFLQVFYYTLDLSDPECKTINVLKTIRSESMDYYNHNPHKFGKSLSNNDNVVVTQSNQNDRKSNIKVNYKRFPDITANIDRIIKLDDITITNAVAQFASDANTWSRWTASFANQK